MSQPLAGQVALVTGSSRGIGAAIARQLAAQGAHVWVSSRKVGACETVVAEIQAAGGQASAVACHIGELAAVRAAVARIVEESGKIDILVNNAAANPYFGPIVETPEAAFDKTVEVNLKGTFFLSSEAARHMAARGAGSIVNIASVNAEIPGFFQGVYSMTKAGIVNLTKAFAKELAPAGVRVNCVLPGFTDTRFASALTGDPTLVAHILQHVPQGRIAQPDEIAGVVAWLVGPTASYTTGSVIPVDGGYLTA